MAHFPDFATDTVDPIKPAKPTKVVWVVSDGVAGHFNQSKGVLLALELLAVEQHYHLDIKWLELTLKRGIYRAVLSLMLNHSQPSIGLFQLFYKGNLSSIAPDIVLGAGGKSSFVVAWLGQAFKAKTIFVGSLRRLKAQLFNAVLILEPNAAAPFISLAIAPMPISQSLLNAAATQYPLKPLAVQALYSMLIGGDGAGAKYTIADWQSLALAMNSLAAQHNIRWLVTTSRRTGANAELVLQHYLNPDFIADAIWWNNAPKAVTAAFLGLSRVVYCTVDSMSMLMESISAMRPVIAVAPTDFKPDHNFEQALHRLQQQQYLAVVGVDQLAQSQQLAQQLKPLSSEPSLYLAKMLQQRLC